VLVALGVIVILTFIIIWLRKPNPVKERATLLHEARMKLAKLKEELPSLTSEDIATRASLIIRRYLEAAFKDPALFETNEELSLRPQALAKIHPDCRTPITDYLSHLSQLKYTPSETENTEPIITQAEDLLANIEINVSPAQI